MLDLVSKINCKTFLVPDSALQWLWYILTLQAKAIVTNQDKDHTNVRTKQDQKQGRDNNTAAILQGT